MSFADGIGQIELQLCGAIAATRVVLPVIRKSRRRHTSVHDLRGIDRRGTGTCNVNAAATAQRDLSVDG